MKAFRYIFLVVLCSMAVQTAAQAQNDWDAVLDRYENITRRCKELRDKAAAGEPVSQKSVTTLLGEMNRLRNSLQASSGKMTRAQRERFRMIKELYQGKDTPSRPATTENKPKVTGQARTETPPDLPVESITEVKGLSTIDLRVNKGLAARMPKNAKRSVATNARLEIRKEVPREWAVTPEPQTRLRDRRLNIIALTSFGDVQNYGFHVSYIPDHVGGYASVRTNLVSQLYAYECLSDGTTPGIESFKGNGAQRIGEYSFTAGAAFKALGWLDLFAGAGYGSSTLCWGDSLGAWAKVKDYSGAGLVVEAGAVFHIGPVCLLGGVSKLTAAPAGGPFMPVFSIGAGMSF